MSRVEKVAKLKSVLASLKDISDGIAAEGQKAQNAGLADISQECLTEWLGLADAMTVLKRRVEILEDALAGWQENATAWEIADVVQSRTKPGLLYSIRRHRQTGRLVCECADFRFRRITAGTCVHILAFNQKELGQRA